MLPHALLLHPRGDPFRQDLRRFHVLQLHQCLVKTHELGYIHRDINPDNVLKGSDGVLLIDWGYAVKASDAPIPYSGTFHFASDAILDCIATKSFQHKPNAQVWHID
jgi:serine/threonine protein kinase